MRVFVTGVTGFVAMNFSHSRWGDLLQCGWTAESPVLGAFVEPIDTWADMTHLLSKESWPIERTPKQLAYFCGVMEDPEVLPHAKDVGFPAREMERTSSLSIAFLKNYVRYLWPAAVRSGPEAEFDWGILAAGDDFQGEKRFDAQILAAKYRSVRALHSCRRRIN